MNVESLTVGNWADIVAVPGDPLENILIMEKTIFLMKDGAVHKSVKE
jgi:imidazolonepropionase-like amidohydrolase